MQRRTFLLATAAALAGCATRPSTRGTYETTEVPAPVYNVGDRWTYRRTDGYNGLPRGILTRTVERTDKEGLRIVTRDEHGSVIEDAVYTAPGIKQAGTFSEDGPMVGRCVPPYREYDFPLVAGKRWRDAFYLERSDPGGNRNYVMVSSAAEGWEDVQVGDRSFHALVLRRSMNLGDKSFWYGTLYRHETEWYVPALKAFARMHTNEEFIDRSGGSRDGGGTWRNGDRFIYQLESWQLVSG